MTSSAPRPDAVRIAVFAKAPVAGEVKTRLAPLLGAAGAAELHASLVRHAISTALRSAIGPVELWCAPDESHPFFARCAQDFGVALHTQRGADLGERMGAAFSASLAQAIPLVLIGSDCAAMDASHLREAARALRSHDAVIAPAEDGGYVLVGLSRSAPTIFSGIEWGASTVMARTRANLARANLRWHELETLWDVDRPDDYARLQQSGLLAEAHS
jgi:uncharacterized protein